MCLQVNEPYVPFTPHPATYAFLTQKLSMTGKLQRQNCNNKKCSKNCSNNLKDKGYDISTILFSFDDLNYFFKISNEDFRKSPSCSNSTLLNLFVLISSHCTFNPRSSLIRHFACIGVTPLRRFRSQAKACKACGLYSRGRATPMQAKWIKLDVFQSIFHTRTY